MASSLPQSEITADPPTKIDCRTSGTVQYVFKVDVPPHRTFARTKFAHQCIFVEYVGLWMNILPDCQRILNCPIMFFSSGEKEDEMREESSYNCLSAGEDGIKKGDILTLEYNGGDETCLVTLRAGDGADANASANSHEESEIIAFDMWCRSRGMGSRALLFRDYKHPAAKKSEDMKDVYLDPDMPEHDDESGGALIGNVKTLYEDFAELKLKGRL